MITEKDFKPELIETMLEQHKNIMVDFANSFLETFGDVISKEELLMRINRVNYIGFERQEKTDERCGDADAEFNSTFRKIIISSRHNTSNANTIKSLLYHELIHAISYHSEKNLDSCFNQYETNRTGLNRQNVEFDAEYDGLGFNEGELLEEIMTEYYNTVLLQKEGIDFKGISVLNNHCFDQDYVEYHGTGYYNIAALGQIYNFLFGKEILRAKLHDGNGFRKRFNELFDNTDVFKNIFNNVGFTVSSYSKFVAQKDIMGRYRTACKMFIKIFKQEYKNEINDITDLLKNNDFNNFLNMLVRTKNRFEETSKVNEELFLLTKELEKDLVAELFGSELKDNQFGIDTTDIETSIFLTIEKIYNENKNMDLTNIRYSVFYDNHFKGIYLLIGDDKYIIDYKALSQEIYYAKLKKFSDSNFTKEDIDAYSREYKMDISNAEFCTIIDPTSKATFIVNNGKLYNHYGEEIVIDNYYNYTTSVIDNKAHFK